MEAGQASRKEEVRLHEELNLDPIQNQPRKPMALTRHLKTNGASVFAVTEGEKEPQVSRGLARKIRDLTRSGELEWLLERDPTETVSVLAPRHG